MRTVPPPLLPVFRSDLQGRLLALLFASPRTDYSLSELARRLEAPVSTVYREVARLEKGGLLATRLVGRTRLVRPNEDLPYRDELAALVLKVYGPVHVLADALASIDGIDEAWIYGSWAARARGTPGAPPADLDVIVVGSPDPDELYGAAEEAQSRLGLEVNVMSRSREAWHQAEDGFVRTVRDGPLVPIPLREG